MTTRDENRAWSRMYREIPEEQVREDARDWRNFLIAVWLLILLAVSSIAYTVTSFGAEILQ